MREKGTKQGGLSWVTIGECLDPYVESRFFRITDVEITKNNADATLVHAGQCGWIRPNLLRNCLKVLSSSKLTLTIMRLCRCVRMLTRWAVTSNQMCHNCFIR